MQKGKCGVYLWFFAALAFVLALLGQVTLCALTLGFVLVVEKDEWLTRQAIQAFALAFIGSVVSFVLSVISPITDLISIIPVIGGHVHRVLGYVSDLIDLLIAIFAIIALVKVVKGKEADLPVLSGIADKAFGIVRKKVQQQPMQQPMQQQPMQQQPMQQAPVQQQVPQPVGTDNNQNVQ